jgi:hypothetical protein
LEDEESKRDYTQGKVEEDEETKASQSGDVSSKLVRLVKVPTTEEVLADSAIQPLAHLAAPTVRAFELVYSEGATEVLLSAESVEDMGKYAQLLNLVYGSMKYEARDQVPEFLKELPRMIGLVN